MKNLCIHLVPHTHWDREWYFTSAKSKIYLINNMYEILDMLESNPNYPCYVLDGQTVVLEDYLSTNPQDEQRIKKLVNEGRLKIGPWYTQTDEMVVGGESIVRNLLYGKLDCDKFGSRMMIGYLPDSFGQSAAMPKILNGFGIEKSLFWRGYSQRLGIDKSEFLWESDDGSKAVVQLLPINYSVGKNLSNNVDKLHEQLDFFLEKLVECSTTGHILVPNGHDQMPIQQNIFEIIELIKAEYPDFDVTLSSYEDLYDFINKDSIKTIKGELLDGKYMRAHRSIFSSRADLKTQNTRIENKITNILEPLASVSYFLGFDYQSGTIEQTWRRMLKNHAHDSIGCCCTDIVNKQVERRFDVAEDTVDNLIDFYMRKILESSEGDEEKIIVFNTLPFKRRDCYKVNVSCPFENFDLQDANGNLIDYEIISFKDSLVRDESGNYSKNYVDYSIAFSDSIPPMGYKIYKIVKSDNKKNHALSSDDKVLENDYFKIEINENGSLTITDKKTSNVYKNVLLFEDSADGGDSYDYSPIENDYVITSENVSAKLETKKSSYYESAKISFRFDVPKDMNSRIAKKIDSYINVKLNLNINKTSPIINLSISIDNQAEDHRIRVLVPQNLIAENSISDVQFGSLKRNVYDDAIEVWQDEKWDECPDPIYPFLSYVYPDNDKGLAVLSNSVREFEFINTNQKYDTIAVTLFRSFGQQGRSDLLRRPGRASGTKQPTPDAQLIGVNTYELAITTDLENVAQLAKVYTSPVASYSSDPAEDLQLNKSNVNGPLEFSLFETDNDTIILTSVKKEEKGRGLCVRMFNTLDKENVCSINGKIKVVSELMLDETLKNDKIDASTIKFKPFEIKTLLMEKV